MPEQHKPEEKPEDKPKAEGKPQAEPEVTFTPAPELTKRVAEERAGIPHCAQCGRPLQPYAGQNPHKQGSFECKHCHTRVAG